MKHLTFTLLLLVIVSMVANAQDDEMDHYEINNSRIKRPVIKADISQIINFSEALLPLAIEYRFGKVVSAEVEVAVPMFFNTLIYKSASGPVKDLNSDMKFRADLRFYFISESETDNAAYVGIDGSFRKQQFKLSNGEFYNEYSHVMTFSSADIDKIVYTANVIVGMQVNLSGRLFVEMQAGLGFKSVEVERSNISGLGNGQQSFSFFGEKPIGQAEDKIASKARVINIPFAVRLCYRL